MIYQDPPIAILQLRTHKPQTFAAIASIAFITLLLFMQIGFRTAFLNSLLILPENLEGDLFLFSTSTVSSLNSVEFSKRRLDQIPAFDEVERVSPLYLQGLVAYDPTGKPEFLTRILVIGFPINENPLTIPELDNKLYRLKESGVFLVDRLSRPEFNPIIQQVKEQGRMKISVVGNDAAMGFSIKGLFSLGTNDAVYAHLLASDITFMDTFKTQRENIDIGVIYLKEGVDINEIQRKITKDLPADVVIRQKHEVLKVDRDMFEFKTPIGVLFRVGIVVSVLIGIVVLYQILFQLTSKYLPDYATLKALGFSHMMLLSIVLNQAFVLAIIGYFFGWFFSAFFFYDYLSSVTNMKFILTLTVAAAVFGLVCFICLISALLSIRKLSEADPAELFG